MATDEAERELLNLPPDHPLAAAVKAIIEERDEWRRQAERAEQKATIPRDRTARLVTRGAGT